MTVPENILRNVPSCWVFADIARIWGRMLYAGATSFWETEDGADAFDQANIVRQ